MITLKSKLFSTSALSLHFKTVLYSVSSAIAYYLHVYHQARVHLQEDAITLNVLIVRERVG